MTGTKNSKWRVAGLMAIALTYAGAAIAWTAVSQIGRSLDRTTVIAEETLDAVDETMEAAASALDSAIAGVDEAGVALDETESAFDVTEIALGDLSEIVRTDLASSVAAIESVLPDLRRAGDAIDTAVGTLEFLGVDTGSGSGLGAGLGAIESSLQGTADKLRDQSTDIDDVADSVSVVEASVSRLGDDLVALSAALESARDSLRGYEQATGDLRELLAESPSGDIILPLRLLIVIGAIVATVAVAPLVARRDATLR